MCAHRPTFPLPKTKAWLYKVRHCRFLSPVIVTNHCFSVDLDLIGWQKERLHPFPTPIPLPSPLYLTTSTSSKSRYHTRSSSKTPITGEIVQLLYNPNQDFPGRSNSARLVLACHLTHHALPLTVFVLGPQNTPRDFNVNTSHVNLLIGQNIPAQVPSQ